MKRTWWARGLAAVGLLVLGLLLARGGRSDAPPARGLVRLNEEQQRQITALEQQRAKATETGRFEEAEKAAQQVAALREKWQGERHWETIDARQAVEEWQRLTKVPGGDRAEVVRALRANAAGVQQVRRGHSREAEAKLREALVIRKQVLGDEHPDTATSYNNVAGCLQAQGKAALALPLLEKALAIRKKVLGDEHLDTANSYGNVASCLQAQGKAAQALPLHEKALAIFKKVRGEDHPSTATSYNNVAVCLGEQGKAALALPLHENALAIRKKVLGDEHPDTAGSYNGVASCLRAQGKAAQALPLYEKALAIRKKVLGDEHPDTATSYNGVASCLLGQGKSALALPLLETALAIRKKVLGDEHPSTATSYNNVAYCLNAQGKTALAVPLLEKALAIRKKGLGDEHPDTAAGYNGVGFCLQAQGKAALALPLLEKALAIRKKVLGDEHPDTATSYNGVGSCLQAQGKAALALPLLEKALAIWKKVHGEVHPYTATSYNNVASCLDDLGRAAQALPRFEKALAIRKKVLGEGHPDTAISYNWVGSSLHALGKYAEAATCWEKALLGFAFGRLSANDTGFGRSLFQADRLSPRAALAASLVREGKPAEAWEHAESDLGRGLLDDLDGASPTTIRDTETLARLHWLDQALVPLLSCSELDADQRQQRDGLVKERDTLLGEMAREAVRRSRVRVLPLARIQKQIADDAAVVFWLDSGPLDQHLGCVVRRKGPPVWVKLPGSGKDKVWSREDDLLPALAYHSLRAEFLNDEDKEAILADTRESDRSHVQRAFDPAQRARLLRALYGQRLAPLQPHLEGVRRLIVIPAGQMAVVPVETLSERYTVTYAPSASVFARRVEEHRPLQATSLLVLADPTFERASPQPPPAPPHGLLVKATLPGSLAARIPLRPGDVLLEYNARTLKRPDDLKPSAGDDRVSLQFWREGKTLAGRIPSGTLGVVVDDRPLAEALAAWRDQERKFRALLRGKQWARLPGTRQEAETLQALVPKTTLLLGSEASEQQLERLAASGELKTYRLLHLATHGEANKVLPEETALILALEARLTVETIRQRWQLDADLVVLSACESGLGKQTDREGMLGFAHVLMQKGARSVVLSRWKVEDSATALLMLRFYENLLGKRDGGKGMGRAKALQEARSWLRTLPRKDAGPLVASLAAGTLRSTYKEGKPIAAGKPPALPKGDHPYAHPFYWAAFVLLGDPD